MVSARTRKSMGLQVSLRRDHFATLLETPLHKTAVVLLGRPNVAQHVPLEMLARDPALPANVV